MVASYNKLSEFEDKELEFHKEAAELYTHIEKTAMDAAPGVGTLLKEVAGDLAKSWKVIKEIPAKYLVGVPMAFLLGVMYQKSKDHNDAEKLTVYDTPLIYRAYQ